MCLPHNSTTAHKKNLFYPNVFLCLQLSTQSTLSTHAIKIFDILTEYLCQEHIEYALEIGLQGIPSSEPKSFPQIYFFNVAGEANAIFHLLEKQFSDVLVPLIR